MFEYSYNDCWWHCVYTCKWFRDRQRVTHCHIVLSWIYLNPQGRRRDNVCTPLEQLPLSENARISTIQKFSDQVFLHSETFFLQVCGSVQCSHFKERFVNNGGIAGSTNELISMSNLQCIQSTTFWNLSYKTACSLNVAYCSHWPICCFWYRWP